MTPPRALSALAAVLVLGGCTASPSPAPSTSAARTARFQNYPATYDDVRFVWSAAPGIDLTAGVAVAIRAYYESRLLAQGTYDLRNVYPGFTRAVTYVEHDLSGAPEQRNNPGPFIAHSKSADNGDYDGQPLFGNVHLRILSITQPRDDVQAIVCFDERYRYERLAPDRYALLFADAKPRLERLDLSDHDPRTGPTPPASPLVPQRGPLPAPLEDVFGPWHVQGLGLGDGLHYDEPDGTYTKVTPGYEEWRRQCDDIPLPADQRPGASPNPRDTPPPYAPASPGWPGPTS